MTRQVTEWTAENEMSVGKQKCGIMVVNKPLSMLHQTPARWQIAGQLVPIVSEYTYLGLRFTADLDVPSMLSERVAKGKRLVDTLTPFLRTRVIPVPMKVAVVRGVAIPRLLFGAEVYGMNKAITEPMQVLLNQVWRMVGGMNRNPTVSTVAIWREMGTPPICAMAAARRARALQKCRKLNT
ncbi:unnamed protein product, partial [Ascophyllum nodosum]